MQRLNIARKGIANAEGKVHPSHFSRSKVDRHHIRTKLGIRPIPWPVESFIEKPEKHPNEARASGATPSLGKVKSQIKQLEAQNWNQNDSQAGTQKENLASGNHAKRNRILNHHKRA